MPVVPAMRQITNLYYSTYYKVAVITGCDYIKLIIFTKKHFFKSQGILIHALLKLLIVIPFCLIKAFTYLFWCLDKLVFCFDSD